MATPAQITANRSNASRSTGPRSNMGKAKSSKNALKHGLLSADMTLPDEDVKEFDRFSSELLEQLSPQGSLEEMLAERLVANAWRLRRVYRLESGLLTYQMLTVQAEEARSEANEYQYPSPSPEPDDPDRYYGALETAEQADRQLRNYQVTAGLLKDASESDALSKLGRYETSVERGMYRALHELQRLQATRTGQAVAAPAVVDVEVTSGR